MSFSSRIPDFYNKTTEERRKIIAGMLSLSKKDISILQGKETAEDIFEIMIENVVGMV